MNNALPEPIVFSDFDGTVTQLDVTDRILAELAEPGWEAIEDEWVGGRIGSRQCLERQMALVSASPPQLDELIDAIPVDAGFSSFYQWVRESGVPFYVVSDGFDYVIRRVLRRAGVNGLLRNGRDLFSSALQVRGGKLATSFPHPPAGCEHGCATCKPAIMRRKRRGRRPVVFIGDGLSDRLAVHEADIVFAKDKLLAYCRERGVAAHPFVSFTDVGISLDAMLAPNEPKRQPHASRKAAVSVA